MPDTSSSEESPDYCQSLNGAEWFVTLSRGGFAFRYGPYAPDEAGKILRQCNEELIPCFMTAYCGTEFDWDVARDFARGNPADWREMDEAPRNGMQIIADVAGVETRIVWWDSWEWWRQINPDGSIGNPVDPRRWRSLNEGEVSYA